MFVLCFYAVLARGMALAFGNRGQKDFGFSTNMTLPMVSVEPDPSASSLMPQEKKGKRKQARFAPDQELERTAPSPKVRQLQCLVPLLAS